MIDALKSIEPIGFLSFAPASAGTNRADVYRRIIQNCPHGRGVSASAAYAGLFGSGSAGLGLAGTKPILALHPLEALMLGDGGDRDRAADGLGPRNRELHKADRRFHEKTRQIDRIADGHGFYEEKLEERRRELGMQVACCGRREPAAGGRVLKAGPKPKDQTTQRLVLPVPPDAEILLALHLGWRRGVGPEQQDLPDFGERPVRGVAAQPYSGPDLLGVGGGFFLEQEGAKPVRDLPERVSRRIEHPVPARLVLAIEAAAQVLEERVDRLISDSSRAGHHRPKRQALPQIHDFVGMLVDHTARKGAGAVRRHYHPIIDLDRDENCHDAGSPSVSVSRQFGRGVPSAGYLPYAVGSFPAGARYLNQ